MNRSALAEVLTPEGDETQASFEKLALRVVHKTRNPEASVTRRVTESLDRELANGNMPA
jgi:hypothetical protein